MIDTQRPSTARGSLTVSAWTMVSRVTGLLRVVVIGAVLGPTFFANAFLAANSVPNLTYTAMAGPVLAMVLVPVLVRSLADPRASADLVAKVTGYLVTVATAAAGALALASPLLALALTAGIPDGQVREQAWRLTILVVLFVAPQVVCYTLAGIGVAVQQAHGRFALAAAAPAVENLGLIATMAAVELCYRPGPEVADIPVGMVLLMGLGSTASVAVHAGAQLFGAHRVGLPIRLRRGWRTDRAARDVTRRLRRSVIVAAFPSASMFGMLAFAATVPGGTFVFQAGISVYFVVGALGAKAVTVAALPGMSAAVERNDTSRFAGAWRQALSLAVTASLPAACLLLAFAEPAAAVLANGRLRNPEILGWMAACVAVFAVATFANAVNEIGRQALFARLDDTGPRLFSTVTLAIRLAIGAASLALPAGQPRLVALCCGVLVGEAVAAVLGLRRVRAAIRPERLLDRRRLRQVGLATAAMLPALVLGRWVLHELVAGRVAQVLAAIGLGLLASACFGLALAALTGYSVRDGLASRAPTIRRSSTTSSSTTTASPAPTTGSSVGPDRPSTTPPTTPDTPEPK